MSLIIFASIVSQVPAQFSAQWTNEGIVAVVAFALILSVALVGTVFVENGYRRIPVNFAKRVVGPCSIVRISLPSHSRHGMGKRHSQLRQRQPCQPVVAAVRRRLWFHDCGLAYFCTAITFDPAKQADTIGKQGGFIPGIPPGPQTEHYLARILTRITLPGALFIAAVALVPNLLMRPLGFNLTNTGDGGLATGGFGLIGITCRAEKVRLLIAEVAAATSGQPIWLLGPSMSPTRVS